MIKQLLILGEYRDQACKLICVHFQLVMIAIIAVLYFYSKESLIRAVDVQFVSFGIYLIAIK